MSEILVNTIKKADGTGGLTVPTGSGTVATLAGGTFTGNITMSSADLVVGSNSIFIGGTGSANELSDYEEGTFTATLTVSSGTAPTTPPTTTGHYRKIGAVVYCSVQFDSADASGSGGGGLQITGLPFPSSLTSGVGSPMTFNVPSASTYNAFYIPSGDSRIRLYEISNNGGWSTVSLPSQSTIYVWHSFTYTTNQ